MTEKMLVVGGVNTHSTSTMNKGWDGGGLQRMGVDMKVREI